MRLAGYDSVAAGAGSTTIDASNAHAAYVQGGAGADTVVAGSGAATMQGGSHDDLFALIDGSAGGGHDLIVGFTAGDLIGLQRYGDNAVRQALRSATIGPSGIRITLSDHTSITFAGLSTLRARDFVTLDSDRGGPGDDNPLTRRFGDS